ncbi:hypothetical protein ACG7TL_006661 [Trametes sanguinea]
MADPLMCSPKPARTQPRLIPESPSPLARRNSLFSSALTPHLTPGRPRARNRHRHARKTPNEPPGRNGRQ